MTITSYDEGNTTFLGSETYLVSGLTPVGGDYKIPFGVDISTQCSSLPYTDGIVIVEQIVARVTFVCTSVLTNTSASKLCLSPLTLGSYCYDSYGYKVSPGYLNYKQQQLPAPSCFSARDLIGTFLGDLSFNQDLQPTVGGCIADTLYFRLDGAVADSCSFQFEWYLHRLTADFGTTGVTWLSAFASEL